MLRGGMCNTSMSEEGAMIQFLNRSTDYPFLTKWKNHEDRAGHNSPVFAIDIRGTMPAKRLMDSTSLASGEAYMKGKPEIEGSLCETLDHFLGQMDRFSVNCLHLKKLLHPSNSRKNQEVETSSHYDIGNNSYRLWLDEVMSYFRGYLKTKDDTLYEAQVNKTNYILRKLVLEEGMSLPDVDCRWGFLLIRAARGYGARGANITLSTEQYNSFKKHIGKEGLEHLLDVRLMGHKDLPQSGIRSDRVVSVGVVEHVGRESYDRFMDCVSKVLNPGGVLLLHSISNRKEYARDPWIRKYIFPDGVIPSLREIISPIAEHDFHILDVEGLGDHYNKALLCWERDFKEHGKEVGGIFDKEFVRMWDSYLCSYTATFRNGVIDLHQMLVSKGVNNELPIVQ